MYWDLTFKKGKTEYTSKNVDSPNVFDSVLYWIRNGWELTDPPDFVFLNNTARRAIEKENEEPIDIKRQDPTEVYEVSYKNALEEGKSESEARKIASMRKKRRVTMQELVDSMSDDDVSKGLEKLLAPTDEKKKRLGCGTPRELRKKLLRTNEVVILSTPQTHRVSIMGQRGSRRYTIIEVELKVMNAEWRPAQWIEPDGTVIHPSKASDKAKNPYMAATDYARSVALEWFFDHYLPSNRIGLSDLAYSAINADVTNLIYRGWHSVCGKRFNRISKTACKICARCYRWDYVY